MTFATTYCSHLDLCSKEEKNLQQSRNENRTNVQSLSSAEKKNLARKDEPVAMVASPVLKKNTMASENLLKLSGQNSAGWKLLVEDTCPHVILQNSGIKIPKFRSIS